MQEVKGQSAMLPLWELPAYTVDMRKRIAKARERAAEGTRRAWLVGTNPRTGGIQYYVFSSKGNERYSVHAYSHPRWGGYCYSIGNPPIEFVTCTCEAAQVHNQPCRHAARTALRRERECQDGR